MKCLLCASWSLTHICKACQNENLEPSFYKRKIRGNIDVYSFYKYKEIEKLLHTKHTDLGFYIYSLLGKIAFSRFAENFSLEEEVVSLGVDEHVKHGYSHTAILNRALRSEQIHPRFNKISAGSSDTYSGKNFQYRLLHPRKFQVRSFREHYVILVDDIITTGMTLTQAVEALEREGKEVLFCLTLADAQK
ncbi:MAG: phosphoribosyltransferase family protein [Helicobacteraceae bacterium]|jgi:competence protein ComFC|nr:phosphoribosyltransferase family protein [Helicobacteraceae bacterium]